MDHPSVGKLVGYETSYPVGRITMNRADKRNALSRELIDELTGAFTLARNDDRVRCIILAAAGPVFCAGMDLGELRESLQTPPDSSKVWEEALRLGRLYDLIYTAPKPTLALVAGPAVAGGSGLVTVCDLALATPEARFGYPEVRRGLVAAMVMPHLLRHVGEPLARYLLLSGELIDAATALQYGLINEIVSAEQMPARVDALIRSLVEGGLRR